MSFDNFIFVIIPSQITSSPLPPLPKKRKKLSNVCQLIVAPLKISIFIQLNLFFFKILVTSQLYMIFI